MSSAVVNRGTRVRRVLHHFGVDLDSALAAVIIWRAVSLFLPALVGLGTYGVLRATGGNSPGSEPDPTLDLDVVSAV